MRIYIHCDTSSLFEHCGFNNVIIQSTRITLNIRSGCSKQSLFSLLEVFYANQHPNDNLYCPAGPDGLVFADPSAAIAAGLRTKAKLTQAENNQMDRNCFDNRQRPGDCHPDRLPRQMEFSNFDSDLLGYFDF